MKKLQASKLGTKLVANKKIFGAVFAGIVAVAFAGGYWKSHHAPGKSTSAADTAKKEGEKSSKKDLATKESPKKDQDKESGEEIAESKEQAAEGSATEAEMADKAKAEKSDEAVAEPEHKSWFQTYVDAYQSAREKWGTISDALAQNERLTLENARLRLALESTKFDCGAKDAAARTQQITGRLDKETGARVARTWDTIAYRPPTNIVPNQLYTLGVSYFKGREDEKAAVIFTILTGMEDNDSFRNAKNWLMTGVAWYRLDNLKTADEYFQKVVQSAANADNNGYIAQARLWRAIVAERLGKHRNSQDLLRELVDYHPHSTEAAWVNSREANRATASDEE
jgi:tetratricopeptide (TPR) repeat protein